MNDGNTKTNNTNDTNIKKRYKKRNKNKRNNLSNSINSNNNSINSNNNSGNSDNNSCSSNNNSCSSNNNSCSSNNNSCSSNNNSCSSNNNSCSSNNNSINSNNHGYNMNHENKLIVENIPNNNANNNANNEVDQIEIARIRAIQMAMDNYNSEDIDDYNIVQVRELKKFLGQPRINTTYLEDGHVHVIFEPKILQEYKYVNEGQEKIINLYRRIKWTELCDRLQGNNILKKLNWLQEKLNLCLTNIEFKKSEYYCKIYNIDGTDNIDDPDDHEVDGLYFQYEIINEQFMHLFVDYNRNTPVEYLMQLYDGGRMVLHEGENKKILNIYCNYFGSAEYLHKMLGPDQPVKRNIYSLQFNPIYVLQRRRIRREIQRRRLEEVNI